MKALNEHMKLPYRMEIVEDTDEGDMWPLIRSFQAV